MGPLLMQMMESGGTKAADLEFVILSHGHEDHDGGLFALKQAAWIQVMAHEPYEALTAFSSDQAPSETAAKLPGLLLALPHAGELFRKALPGLS